MLKRNPAAQFLLDVCSGVRWKKAHCAITQELANHIDDQTSAYRAEGMPPEEAEQEAVRQMGDPVALGKQFDAVYRPPNRLGLIVCIALMLLGSVFLQVCLLPGGLRISQAAVMICGLAVAAAAYFIDFRQLFARWALPALSALFAARWLVFSGNQRRVHPAFLFAAALTAAAMRLCEPLPQSEMARAIPVRCRRALAAGDCPFSARLTRRACDSRYQLFSPAGFSSRKRLVCPAALAGADGGSATGFVAGRLLCHLLFSPGSCRYCFRHRTHTVQDFFL